MGLINAQPFDFEFKNSEIALIVIDMQRDFMETGGFGETLGNDVSLLRSIIPKTKELLAGFRALGLPIIHTRECHKPDLSDLPDAKRDRGNPSLRIGDEGPMGRILVAGEPGADIIPELYPINGEVVIDKPGKGAFYQTDLPQILAKIGIKQLVFAGVTTEVCVQTTMREANDRGYDCILATDATESYFPNFKESAIDMIKAQGAIVGWVSSVDEILEGLKS
ncbi:MAG: cysteine hydrolase [Rhizobiaceae bacterium]|nr:cysteine hydrolase [Rhizobiaceae bacterium]